MNILKHVGRLCSVLSIAMVFCFGSNLALAGGCGGHCKHLHDEKDTGCVHGQKCVCQGIAGAGSWACQDR